LAFLPSLKIACPKNAICSSQNLYFFELPYN